MVYFVPPQNTKYMISANLHSL